MSSPAEPSDLVDRFARYVLDVDMSKWEAAVAEFFEAHVFPQSIPSAGYIVELGTARSINFARLCDHYGAQRCLGVDVVNYGNHPRVIEADVRKMTADFDLPIALGWNDLADWKSSPASKRAGYEYLHRNLVPGGLMVDAAFNEDAYRSLDFSSYTVVAEEGLFKLFRRDHASESSSASSENGLPSVWQERLGQSQCSNESEAD